MTVKDQLKILDRMIKQNRADYDLYRQNTEISALRSGDLDKYEYLTDKDLQYKPDPLQKAKFEHSSLGGQVFNKGLDSSERQEGLLKRLKNIEDKTVSQLDLMKSQGTRQQAIETFYSGADQKILELQSRAKRESIENMTDSDKVFRVKINKEPFKIDKYTNLACFGNFLFKGLIPLKKAKEQQEKISGIINELKRIHINKPGRPLSKDNKDEIENLVKNAKDILKTRRDIIKAYKKSRTEKTLNLIDLEQTEEDEENEEDEDTEEDEEDEGDEEDEEDEETEEKGQEEGEDKKTTRFGRCVKEKI